MKIGQYCQRRRCKHVQLKQFWQAFASRGFVSDSWAFLLIVVLALACLINVRLHRMVSLDIYVAYILFNVCLLFTVCVSLYVFVCFVFLCSMGLSLK